MAAHLLVGAASPTIQALVVLAVSGTVVLRSWVAYRKTVAQEEWRTRRLAKAIEGANPHQRSEIIRACGLLEGSAAGNHDTTESMRSSSEKGRPISRSFPRIIDRVRSSED